MHGNAQIVMASVGWADEEDYVFPGEPDAGEDGAATLIRAQLYSGRDNSKPLTPGRAQGAKIVCQLAEGQSVPPKDRLCYVAIPDGMMNVPGAGVIICTIQPGGERRRNIKAGNETMSPSSGEALVILDTNGAITLHTTDNNANNGRSVFLQVSPKALTFNAPWGKLTFDATGFHLWTKSGDTHLDMGGIALPGVPDSISSLLGGYVTVTAPIFRAKASTCFLGSGAVYNPAVGHPLDPASPPPHLVPTPMTAGSMLQSGSVWLAP